MDEMTNRNQHETLFKKIDHLEKEGIEMKIIQKNMRSELDELKESHKTHGKKLGKHGEWILRIGTGGAIVLLLLDRFGVFEKLAG